MYSPYVTGALPPVGFPIRKSPGQSLFSGSPKLIAAYHVLHRLSLPRHPPYALSSLTIKKIKSINTAMSYSENHRINNTVDRTTSGFYLQITICNCQRTVLNTTPKRCIQNGGGERDRTDDPLRARQVLSQLSYAPIFENGF